MNNVNKTLYIPLYGKAYVSKKGLFLSDKKAEEIWDAEGFKLRGKAKSKWLAYYMGIRSAVFDGWVKEQMSAIPDAAIIHIGCGMDSRIIRVGASGHKWYDVDFPEVISERGKYYTESDEYSMIAGDARCPKEWLGSISERSAIIVMEGVSMYLAPDELRGLMTAISETFDRVALLVDCYSRFAAKMSKLKNPIKSVGVSRVYGVDDPDEIAAGELIFLAERDITPEAYIEELSGSEKKFFKKLYAGRFAKKLYRLYEYKKA